jgi:NtrC-family two-component system response regulator AlgB
MDVRRPNGVPADEVPANIGVPSESIAEDGLLETRNPRMAALLETLRRAAAGDSTILLSGDSGTGKDVLARQIHRWSPRRHGPFVVINCATLAEPLLENDKPGRLEAGIRGTLLFDEIAELPTSLQRKFLRFVQDCSIEGIGSDRTHTVDVRVVAASSRNLEAEVAAGRFRHDLFYRLNVIAFTLPPLRERAQDILLFADWMLKKLSIGSGRPEFRLSPDASAALVSYRWPGNIRELHNALRRAAILARSEVIAPDDLPDSISHPVATAPVRGAYGIRLKDFEREHILRVLASSSTLAQAAAALGINVTTLWRKRRHYGIS